MEDLARASVSRTGKATVIDCASYCITSGQEQFGPCNWRRIIDCRRQFDGWSKRTRRFEFNSWSRGYGRSQFNRRHVDSRQRTQYRGIQSQWRNRRHGRPANHRQRATRPILSWCDWHTANFGCHDVARKLDCQWLHVVSPKNKPL